MKAAGKFPTALHYLDKLTLTAALRNRTVQYSFLTGFMLRPGAALFVVSKSDNTFITER